MDVELVADPSLTVIADALASSRTAALNLRGFFAKVATDIERREEERFASAGGGTWDPLSPAYAAWKARHFPGKGILVRTGRLLAAATGRSGELALSMSSSEMRLAIKTLYAKFQGARAIFGIESDDRARWERLLEAHVTEARDRAIGGIR